MNIFQESLELYLCIGQGRRACYKLEEEKSPTTDWWVVGRERLQWQWGRDSPFLSRWATLDNHNSQKLVKCHLLCCLWASSYKEWSGQWWRDCRVNWFDPKLEESLLQKLQRAAELFEWGERMRPFGIVLEEAYDDVGMFWTWKLVAMKRKRWWSDL